ncbi:MAG: hypothetical protein WAN48_15485 [Actinomycetes bacterium]
MKRHAVDVTSLVTGVVFVLVALLYLTGPSQGWSVDGRWVLPLVLIGLGLAGLVGSVTAVRRQGSPGPVDPVDPVETVRADGGHEQE